MGNLTQKQLTILTTLNLRKPREDRDGPLSGPEVGEMVLAHVKGRYGVRAWAGPSLRTMEAKGLVERLGKSFDNSDCWTITPTGRAALKERAMKPDNVPQDTWEAARNAIAMQEADESLSECVARAILEAEQRGRREGMEESLDLVASRSSLDAWKLSASEEHGWDLCKQATCKAIRSKIEVQK